MEIILIAAVDRDRGIGINGELPWKIDQDMKHFRETTTGYPVVMGRNTYESIGRPLPKRQNIVLTHTARSIPGVDVQTNLGRALLVALRSSPKVFVIGGAKVYAQALPMADRLVITEIAASYKCNEFFPAIGPEWRVEDRAPFDYIGTGPALDLVTYVRK